MRLRLAAAVLVPALALAAPIAGHAGHAEGPLTKTGTILVGHPLTNAEDGGITEQLAPCDTASPLNGLDGVWVDLLDYQGHDMTLTMDATLDADIYYYSAGCVLVGAEASGLLGEPETGSVPADAQYAIVDGYLGTGEFALTVGP